MMESTVKQVRVYRDLRVTESSPAAKMQTPDARKFKSLWCVHFWVSH